MRRRDASATGLDKKLPCVEGKPTSFLTKNLAFLQSVTFPYFVDVTERYFPESRATLERKHYTFFVSVIGDRVQEGRWTFPFGGSHA